MKRLVSFDSLAQHSKQSTLSTLSTYRNPPPTSSVCANHSPSHNRHSHQGNIAHLGVVEEGKGVRLAAKVIAGVKEDEVEETGPVKGGSGGVIVAKNVINQERGARDQVVVSGRQNLTR